MTNRRSPCLTIWPSLKWIESMKPETRERTSTDSTAEKRPVNSFHSVTALCSGFATVTGGGDVAALAAGLPSQPADRLAITNKVAETMRRFIEFAPAPKVTCQPRSWFRPGKYGQACTDHTA